MPDLIGFIIEGIVTDSDTSFHVIGCCGDTPICIGDEFDVVRAPAQLVGGVYSGPGDPSPVSLRVERIEAYQHQLTKLGQGMTGAIGLRGQGLEHVVPGAVLGMPIHATVESHPADSP